MMKFDEMPIGTALLVKRKKGVNEVYDESIREGDYFVELRLSNDQYKEIKLAEQPKSLVLRSEEELAEMLELIGFFNDGSFMNQDYRRGLMHGLQFQYPFDCTLSRMKERLEKVIVEQREKRGVIPN